MQTAVLESLNILRIERRIIKPLGADSSKKGGNADVELACLSLEELVKSGFGGTTSLCVAVKKFRFDDDTEENRVLAVSDVWYPSDWPSLMTLSILQKMTHEINLLSKLSHCNIVKLVGFVEDVKEGIAWIIFPWESNGNLREFAQSANLEVPERISLVCDLMACWNEGLTSIHLRYWTWLKVSSTFTAEILLFVMAI